jgi:hypothetical protein
MSQPKVFGIGLSKTGTTSLTEALRILGYSTIHFPLGLKGVEESDAAIDNPIADKFELLDRKYPGSKFIYTVRQRDEWIRSCRKHFSRPATGVDLLEEAVELKKRLYGTAGFDTDMFMKAYERHEERVLTYFAHRPNDILIINVCSNEISWGTLCSFLGKEVPDCAFPHLNKTKSPFEYWLRDAMKGWFLSSVKKQIRRIKRKTVRGLRLADVLGVREDRAVGMDNTVHYRNRVLQIPADRHGYQYVRSRVKVHERPDGMLAVFHGRRCLAHYYADGSLCGHLPPAGSPAWGEATAPDKRQQTAER